MLIKFSTQAGDVSTIRISETEKRRWTELCQDEGDSLNQTIGWLWSQRPADVKESGNFTQWVRDQFLDRICSGDWQL